MAVVAFTGSCQHIHCVVSHQLFRYSRSSCISFEYTPVMHADLHFQHGTGSPLL